ncbi:MAG: hypothetical protein R3B82_07840 [Sandaracinaceae bacterium]
MQDGLKLGDVRTKVGVGEVAGGAHWFGMPFTLERLTAKEPRVVVLPGTPPSPRDSSSPPSSQMGVDIGVRERPQEESEERLEPSSQPMGVLLSSRTSERSHTHHLVEREVPDLRALILEGRVTDGPKVFASIARRRDGLLIFAEFRDFDETTADALFALLRKPFSESVPLLEVRRHSVIATTAKMRLRQRYGAFEIDPGIHFFFEGRAPASIRRALTTNTPGKWLDFHCAVPLDDQANIDIWSAPPFTATFDDLTIEDARFRIWGLKNDSDEVWDDEDGGFYLARAFLRGSVACGEARVPTYATLVPAHHTLFLRDIGRRLPKGKLSDFDSLVGTDRWREVMPDALRDLPAELVTWSRRVDLATGVHSSVELVLRVAGFEASQRGGRLRWQLEAPVLKVLVGFPRQSPGPQVRCHLEGNGVLVMLPPNATGVYARFVDARVWLQQVMTLQIDAVIANRERAERLARLIGVAPLIRGDLGEGLVRSRFTIPGDAAPVVELAPRIKE